MELTTGDLMRAANLGMDHAEDAAISERETPALLAAALWKAVMGSTSRNEYPADSITRLRNSYDGGRLDYL